MLFTSYCAEHPQSLVDELRYGKYAAEVERGKGRFPVADYSYVHNNPEAKDVYSFCMCVFPRFRAPMHEPAMHRWCTPAAIVHLRLNRWNVYPSLTGTGAPVAKWYVSAALHSYNRGEWPWLRVTVD